MDVRRIKIGIKDNERRNLNDKLSYDKRPRGRVQIYSRIPGNINSIKLEDTSNLIVYRGRNWLMQRALNKDATSRPGWKDKYISWFGVGVKGAVSGSPLTPETPILTDYGLGRDGSGHGLIGSGTRYVTVDGNDYHSFDVGYPEFLHDPDIPEEYVFPSEDTDTDPEDGLTYESDRFLIARFKTTITATECNGDGVSLGCGTYSSGPLIGENYQDINEAGLFISPSNSTGYSFDADDIKIFARVCFSTVRKDPSREIIFVWLVYF